MKILLVDDSRTIRKIQIKVLSQLGLNDVVEANDGVEALAKVQSDTPDLILLDWNMPNMDGLTFLKTLRGSGNKTPVVMVTTEAERTRVIEAVQAGINNYVVKPFTPEALGLKLKETMAKTGLACAV
jgi:two-component system, chemotaxis family, chemotaxis protein CheY